MKRLSQNVLNRGSAQPCFSPHVSVGRCTVRKISLTQAIEKGKRRSKQSFLKHDDRYRENPSPDSRDRVEALRHPPADRKSGRAPRSNFDDSATSRPPSEYSSIESPVPIVDKIPFSSASSEFLFGAFSILSALRARRRRHLYNLYRLPLAASVDSKRAAHSDQTEESVPAGQDKNSDQQTLRRKIFDLAQDLNIDIKELDAFQGKRIFDRLANGRPHSGLILEAAPLPRLQVTGLNALTESGSSLTVTASSTSREDREINHVFNVSAGQATIPSVRPRGRFPFLLFLDGVTNPGNFGAIVRSAWFLGVDAIVVPDHGVSPVSAVSLKASAGALEYMPILLVSDEKGFFVESREAGWKFFAATLPARQESPLPPHVLQDRGALLKHPCVLVLGNEHQGPRPFIHRYMDGTSSITNARSHVADIDSLNVGTAAALLAQRFLDSAQVDSTPVQTQSISEEKLF
ncbi:hypothetical protein B0A52_00731 [Exophiala mesophila]|uniref:tRNA/rRNA methyltransferase SpoU type domain-containing protein n=1 Tax=Exophiala mesophila TaxID=212818 RepID=A0A438NI29_EXOME|nr:hypothetical protein B0A52_00731 [Exophiala mesophila]